MGSLTVFLRYATSLFLAALAAIIAYQLLTGRIRLRGLLSARRRAAKPESRSADGGRRLPALGPPWTVRQDRQAPWTGRPGRQVSPSRIQLLVVTAGVAGYVLLETLRHPGALPRIPGAAVLLLAASHAFYLAEKFNNRILTRIP